MHDTDIRVERTDVRFREVQLDPPLTISGGSIAWFSVACVRVDVESVSGARASGYGESVLSVLWSWPHGDLSIAQRDAAMRDTVQRCADAMTLRDAADPIALWRCASAQLDDLSSAALGATVTQGTGHDDGVRMPRLAAVLALGAVDNAIHDAWAGAAGRDAFDLYTPAHLRDDLAAFGLPGEYPSAGIVPTGSGLERLPVQHVVGVSDPLTRSGAERSLEEWIAAEGVTSFKIKVAGIDPHTDAERIRDVHRLARSVGTQPRLAIDPNEGYRDPRAAIAMLDRLADIAPDARTCIDYLEQPVPRDLAVHPDVLRSLSQRVPVLMDEGFTALSDLPALRAAGWSGIVIKASKGQTPAVVAAAVARRLGLRVAVQDLTATGAAFVHSARLLQRLHTDLPQVEFNSRQYAPAANGDLRRRMPDLVDVVDGCIRTDGLRGPGLYGIDSL